VVHDFDGTNQLIALDVDTFHKRVVTLSSTGLYQKCIISSQNNHHYLVALNVHDQVVVRIDVDTLQVANITANLYKNTPWVMLPDNQTIYTLGMTYYLSY
jgi:hypothetical protein